VVSLRVAYFIYFLLVLILGGSIFVVLNALARQREEEKKKKILLEKSLVQAETKLEREKDGLSIISKVAESVFLTSETEHLIETAKNFIESVLGLDIYALIVIDKRNKKTYTIDKDVSTPMLSEISRMLLGGNIQGLFETDSHILGGMILFYLSEVLGAFFAEKEALDSLSPEDIDLLGILTKQLVSADKGRELVFRAEQIAVTEEITNLFSFQFFKKQLQTEWVQAQRYNRRLSLILLDVDDLHIYHEQYGDEQKEFTVMEISQMLKSFCRRSDVIAHYAGDELAIILPETDVSGAFVAAERIRETISRYEFLGQDGKRDARLTASLGVASYPLYAADIDGLAREVESALYNAKTTGRNRVCGPELPA